MKYLEKNRNIEPHSESILYFYLQDANGVPVTNKKMKIYAGPPPRGEPPYFVDDDPNNPNRRTDGNGKFQFIVANGAPPNRLDFWVQVLGADGNPESDPFQFPFPGGEARWVIVTAAPEGAGMSEGSVPPTPELQLDPRLAQDVGVTVKTSTVPDGQQYWKLISGQYQNPDESGGNISIVLYVQDEKGAPLPGQRVIQKFPGDQAVGVTDERGHYEFPQSPDSSFSPDRGEHGPYSARVDGLPSDEVVGMGLPLKRHVQYVLTYRRAVAGAGPAPATGTIRGRISNAPMGVQVILNSLSQTLTAAINPDGSYSFSNVPAGDFVLKLSSGQTIQQQVKLAAGATLAFDYQFSLPPQATGSVRGRISNAPAGARLVLKSPNRSLDALVAPDGTYSFINVPPGAYTLELSGVGVINANLNVPSGQTTTFDYPVSPPPPPAKKVLNHYLLFGPGSQPGTLTNLILALDYIIHFGPTVGFSVDEALYAEHVTIVGGPGAVSAQDEQRLRDAGAQVARLQAADSYGMENLFQQLLASGSPYPV